MYVRPNFKTKKALKEALKAGQDVQVFQPNAVGHHADSMQNGEVYLEGPHYPESHTWYATGVVKDGKIVRIK